MFERFTDRARRVVVLAQEEARLLNHNYIGTEHILLGLIHEGEGVAAKALESLDISLEQARAQVEEIIGNGGTAPSGHIPFTPRAKKVLELSLREALQLGHNYIGTEHILLGLIREGEGVAAQVLESLGAELSRVRQQVVQVLSGYASLEPRRQRRPVSPRCVLCRRNLDRVEAALVRRNTMVCAECVRAAAAQLDEMEAFGAMPKLARFRRRPVDVAEESAARDAIQRAFDAVIGPDAQPVEEALWAVEGGTGIAEMLSEMRARAARGPFLVVDVTLERVEFVDDSEADVTLGFWLGNSSAPMMVSARALLRDGTWKVSRETVEEFLGHPPDAPPAR